MAQESPAPAPAPVAAQPQPAPVQQPQPVQPAQPVVQPQAAPMQTDPNQNVLNNYLQTQLQSNQIVNSAQKTQRLTMVLAGAFGIAGLAVLLAMVYFQWKVVSRLIELIAPQLSMFQIGGGNKTNPNVVIEPEQSHARLFTASDNVEKRFWHALEHTLVTECPSVDEPAAPSRMESPAPAFTAPTTLPVRADYYSNGAHTNGNGNGYSNGANHQTNGHHTNGVTHTNGNGHTNGAQINGDAFAMPPMDKLTAAASELNELVRRLDQLRTPTRERLRTFESRIEQLEKELAYRNGESRDFVSLKIETTRKQLEIERSRNSMDADWGSVLQ